MTLELDAFIHSQPRSIRAGSYVSYWNPGPERRAQKFTFAKISTDDNGKITIEDRQESWV